MKKLLLMLIIITPLFAGCTNIETTVTIGNDKNALVTSQLTYQGNLNDKSDINAQIIKDLYKSSLDDLYVVSETSGDKISTLSAEKRAVNIEKNDIDLSSLGFKSNNPDEKFVEIKKNFLVTSYNVDFYFDGNKLQKKFHEKEQQIINSKKSDVVTKAEYYQSTDGDFINEDAGRKDFLANIDRESFELTAPDTAQKSNNTENQVKDNNVNATFSIKLPSYAFYNNADYTDGFTYTWKIKNDDITQVKLQYVEYSTYAIFFILFAGISLLCYLAYRIFRHDERKRIEKKEI